MKKYLYLIYGGLKLIVAKFLATFSKREAVWLVCEKTNEARDNGYYFFKYSQEYKKNNNVFYVIDKGSYDYLKISKYNSQIIYTNTLKHCVYYFKSSKLISSQTMPFPFSEKLCKSLFKVKNQKYYWLQHGITKDKLKHEDMDYNVKKYSLVCCASNKEVEFFKTEFGYHNSIAKHTGFCRFDGLIDTSKNENIILIMPTFRKWLAPKNINSATKIEEEIYKKSEFYKKYNELLSDEKINEILLKNNLKIIFYVHYAFQAYINTFNQLNCSNIIIASKNDYDVQDLMKKSKLMITDYSSVFFDFVYMKKPVIYYQFDFDEYRKNHYKEGYFSYKNNGFGPVCETKEELKKELQNFIKNEFQIDDFYNKRINDFFDVIDKNNCKRIYKLVEGDK